MPDADDFDVEYFRNLMKGNRPKEVQSPPAKPALPVERKKMRPTLKPAVAKGKAKPPAGRKKGKDR